MQRQIFETPRGPQSVLLSTSASPSAPWLHFGHATGMHARLYARFLEPLAPHFKIIAADFRGHGESPFFLQDNPINDWQDLSEDTLALINTVAPAQKFWLMGHSLGAVCALLTLTHHPARIAGVMALDPPLLPAQRVPDFTPANLENAFPLIRTSLNRSPHFPDRATIEAAYRGRGVFKTFSEADLMAYLEGGLAPGPNGLHLRCTPHAEAATFNGFSTDPKIWPAALTRPFSLLAGQTNSTVPDDTLARYAVHPLCHEARRLPGTDHFLPLQAGETIRTSLLSLLRS